MGDSGRKKKTRKRRCSKKRLKKKMICHKGTKKKLKKLLIEIDLSESTFITLLNGLIF